MLCPLRYGRHVLRIWLPPAGGASALNVRLRGVILTPGDALPCIKARSIIIILELNVLIPLITSAIVMCGYWQITINLLCVYLVFCAIQLSSFQFLVKYPHVDILHFMLTSSSDLTQHHTVSMHSSNNLLHFYTHWHYSGGRKKKIVILMSHWLLLHTKSSSVHFNSVLQNQFKPILKKTNHTRSVIVL